MRRPGQVASELTVGPDATPAQLAELHAEILRTMTALKHAAT
jgi:hypothetical protein